MRRILDSFNVEETTRQSILVGGVFCMVAGWLTSSFIFGFAAGAMLSYLFASRIDAKPDKRKLKVTRIIPRPPYD